MKITTLNINSHLYLRNKLRANNIFFTIVFIVYLNLIDYKS